MEQEAINTERQQQIQAFMENRPERIPRPRDSASLILLRRAAGGVETLMGQRGKRATFASVYVFPGGKVDVGDKRAGAASDLPAETLAKISAKPHLARSYPMAAVRETLEETGLWITAPGAVGETRNLTYRAMAARGEAPALDRLQYIGQAITPMYRPKRFNARFFMAWEEDTRGTLGGSGELSNLGWVKVKAALDLPTVAITQFMLRHVMEMEAAGFPPMKKSIFFTWRNGKRYIRHR